MGGAAAPEDLTLDLVLVRHASTAWSRSHRHTGRTDLPLDEAGRGEARSLARRLAGLEPARVLVSPLRRARETCELAGFGERAEVLDDLAEWDYGEYEGRRASEVRAERDGWDLFRDGCPGGEALADVAVRAERVLAVIGHGSGGPPVLVFSHGHLLRVLAACFLGWPPATGRQLLLDAGALGLLGTERGVRVLRSWNVDRLA
ncbi:MAG TPA: histidine phosphatase family protein [Acidimicrobiales bacterium]|nr:histidine phosphatase family protein [Acidimicrobiales bacterium]